MMATKFSSMNSVKGVFHNLKGMLKLGLESDKSVFLGFFATSAISAFFPILTSFIYKLLVDQLIRNQNMTSTIPVILIAILGGQYLIYITQDFVLWGLRSTYFDYLFRYKIQNTLNYKFFKKIAHLDIAHLENPEVENLIAKARDTLTWRPPEFLRSFSYLLANFVTYLSAFIILIPYGWWVPCLLTLTTLPRLYLRAKFGKLQWSIYGSGAPEVKRLWYLNWLFSTKEAITESRVFKSQDYLLKKLKDTQNYLYRINKKPVGDFLKVVIYPEIFEVGASFAFALWKLPVVLAGGMSVGSFTFFVSLLGRLIDSAAGFVLNFGEMYENNLYVDHYFDVLKLPRLVKEPKRAVDLGDVTKPPTVEFQNVSFAYPGSKKKVLRNISFTMRPGENVAVVGRNGAGKTTMVKLLCRFYDTTSGKILINGVDIRRVRLAKWYEFLGTLFQEFMHYNFTVAENIMLGNTRVKNKKAMIRAAERSDSAEFIKKLPKKYNQLLGREFGNGVELSQGQWQKLAIARAFYEAAPILVLDEPTSAIDAEAEYEIFNNLEKFYKDRTLFLISHRFSTVRNANKILVLDEGKILEQGTHNELLKLNGLYASMFGKQAIGYK